MTKEKLIEELNKIPGNPDICFADGTFSQAINSIDITVQDRIKYDSDELLSWEEYDRRIGREYESLKENDMTSISEEDYAVKEMEYTKVDKVIVIRLDV